MKNPFLYLKGIHYRNAFIYSLLTFLKLGRDFSLRYKIASEYIKPGDFVLDVCAGVGRLADFLPQDCKYLAIEASPEFAAILSRRGLDCKKVDLHTGTMPAGLRTDVAVLIISLCHFRQTSLDILLESFKKISRKVVIVEDVLLKKRGKNSLLQKAMNYFCSTAYFLPMELFTITEFEQAMRKHSYACQKYNARYWVGCYET